MAAPTSTERSSSRLGDLPHRRQVSRAVIWLLPFYVERLALVQGASRQSVVLHVGLLTGIYAVMQLVFAPLWGRWSDRIGRRPLLLVGIAVGLYLLYFLVIGPVTAEVVGMHIEYASPHFYLTPVIVFYVAATCVSCFFSSHRFVIMFGVLAFFSFIAAYLYQVHALVSIWCFFAAILSLLVYLHLRFRDLGGFPRSPSFVRQGAA